ncbi:deoxynucleoside triphosphate triphosphohydrolase SAMHD1-like [Haliotis rubra]|uniref:deoxynucleoside triphosphate triphosphohydrolase SAMHD1-like n=1 Tax=Haliotis rubra TaxID=36100 RepID=UPI001EE4FA3C|nr:deoxynucleoside triphosphate triphosphohydrolase SAMHD1-like [Haliotis rubra]
MFYNAVLQRHIVANDKTGIDVDKWDYFARDCHMLGIKDNFDHDRYMEMARIIDVDGEGPRICARDKEANNLYDMFHTRMMLHRRAYQHKVKIGVELMIVDALQTVDNIVRISGRDGEVPTDRNISECIDDMAAYSKLNDSILQLVELPITLGTSHQDTEEQKTARDKLERARGILKRLRSRDLYKCVGKRILSPEENLDIQQTKKEIIEEGGEDFSEEHFEIAAMSFDYGKKKKDPISNVRFYSKTNPEMAFSLSKEQVWRLFASRV